MGSWLHDVMRVPVVGDAYEAWGWINETFVLLGLLLTVAGLALLGLSMRGGLTSSDQAAPEGDGQG